MAPERIRTLVADDQPLTRSGLAMILSGEPDLEVVGQVGDGAAAVAEAARLRPDIVVMDVQMPGMDGLEATRQVVRDAAADDPERITRVIMLTSFHEDDAVREALRAGASGFVLKDAAPAELVRAIRVVAAGQAWLDPAVARRLLTDFAGPGQGAVPPATALALLTPREREVLGLLSHGLSVPDVARHLVIGVATVKTHLARLLLKLGLRDRAHAVAFAYRSGLVGPGDPLPPGAT